MLYLDTNYTICTCNNLPLGYQKKKKKERKEKGKTKHDF